ncbi:MAG TPA: flagellar motor switch protein FliN [Methylococcaceae bacterium]|nr:flagellar motor switch protein FliN [Methylococcaceae bacterium]
MNEERESDEAVGDDWAAALAEQQQAASRFAGTGGERPVAFENLRDAAQPRPSNGEEIRRGDVNLDVILDVPVTISMEIGRTHVSIRNLLQLNQGSVVELDRLAGEPLDVLVNGTMIAHGEVVVVNDKFGIRLTDVISPTERIKKLK